MILGLLTVRGFRSSVYVRHTTVVEHEELTALLLRASLAFSASILFLLPIVGSADIKLLENLYFVTIVVAKVVHYTSVSSADTDGTVREYPLSYICLSGYANTRITLVDIFY